MKAPRAEGLCLPASSFTKQQQIVFTYVAFSSFRLQWCFYSLFAFLLSTYGYALHFLLHRVLGHVKQVALAVFAICLVPSLEMLVLQ
jgi:hypothetical protein